jgi:hypothetical protein
LVLGSLTLTPDPARATPAFANRFGVACTTCHTIIPELNAFGQAFADSGYRWPAARAVHPALPIATKVNLAYTSAVDPSGLPKAIVDEVEFLLMGSAGSHLSYRWEQYVVDGGVPGRTRDLFVAYSSDPLEAYRGGRRPTLDVQLGSFTLPLPNDPETFRPTINHYALWDQTVGGNPFNFFDDRIGVNVRYGNHLASLNLVAAQGHDPQSGLPTTGTDTMAALRIGPDPAALWAYRYDGTRIFGPVPDRFSRTGFGLISQIGRAQTSLVLQTGSDSSADGLGTGVASSGGYLQEEWTFNTRLIGVVRLDGLNVPGGFARSTTVSLIYRPYQRARWTLEDVISTQPQTTHTLNAAWLFAF